MWRKIPVLWLLLVGLACPAFSQRHVGDGGGGDDGGGGGGTTPDQSEFLAKLAGRSVTVRVYLHASDPNGAYALVDIPLAEGAIPCNAIKTTYPSIWGSAVVAVWSADQADSVVAESLGRSVWARYYQNSLRPSLYDLAVEREKLDSSWTAVDARGEPIPGASVAAYACLGDYKIEMLLGQEKTDDLGRLRRWTAHGDVSFRLKVEHPDYGIALVEYRAPHYDRAGVYWVPLVPRDSEAAASAVEGTVVDEYGNPVAGAAVKCVYLSLPDGPAGLFYGSVVTKALTDDAGRFAFCVPVLTPTFEWERLPPKGTQYAFEISPPEGSDLGEVFPSGWVFMDAGCHRTCVMAPKDLPMYVHTFDFEHADRRIPRSLPLGKITLLFFRNGFEWLRIEGDPWQHSWKLPSGVLRAISERWPDEEFRFQDIEVTQDSPKHLIFKPMPEIRYCGRVVDETTGTPLPNILVAVGPVSERWEGPSLIRELSQQFESQTAGEPTDQGPPLVYKTHNRVTRSDAEGLFDFTFMPGVAPSLDEFTAVMPGRPRVSTSASALVPDANGLVELPEIEIPPAGSDDDLPSLMFEDENGPVTDPNRLKDIQIEIRTADGKGYAGRIKDFPKGREWVAGVCRAEAVWEDKYYRFEPVDLSANPFSTVVFRPASITPADVTCTGRVVHGATGEPIAGAVVLYNRMPGGRDLSNLTPERWAAIAALETISDVNNPVLRPLLRRLIPSTASVAEMIPQVVRTDGDGWFSLRWRQMPFTRRTDCIQAFAKDFLGAQQQLTFLSRATREPGGEVELRRLESDANGVVAIRPMKLFPAATILFKPVVPNTRDITRPARVASMWTVSDWVIDPPEWATELAVMSRDNGGASVYRLPSIPADVRQRIQVPADVATWFSLCMQPPGPLPPIHKGFTLTQGQVRDLGTLEFLSGVEITVRLIDSRKDPLVGISLQYINEKFIRTTGVTDDGGNMRATVPAYWATFFDIMSGDTRSGVCFFFDVGGREHIGVIVLVELSDSLIESMRNANEDKANADGGSMQPLRTRQEDAGAFR